MASLSDQLLVVAILGYLAAMICHTAEYSLRSAPSRHNAAALRELTAAIPRRAPAVTISPGSSAYHATELPTDTSSDRPAASQERTGTARVTRTPAGWTGLAAVLSTVAAVLAHLGAVASRGVAAGRMPWGNMYEFILSATLVGATIWLILLLRRPQIRSAGLFVTLTLVMLLGAAGMIAYTPVAPLVPALRSYWFVIHVSAAITSSGIFLAGFVPAALYLIRAGHDRGLRRFPYTLGIRLPAADQLERLTFRLHAFAFPIWTFAALIAGPIWAEASWGRYWGWDPKEVWAFVSWVIYAGYLHAHATPSIKRNTVTWIAVIGWLSMLVNLFGVNLFFGGLHSYAGVK